MNTMSLFIYVPILWRDSEKDVCDNAKILIFQQITTVLGLQGTNFGCL